MSFEQGSFSINSENIFPIIKKWLYSDHDIFFRELVSNGCDAITKLKKLALIGETELPADEPWRIDIIADPTEKTLTFIDNGVGMTADEVKEYINQIAFSGAADFLAKYKDKASEDQIIGHFGLGFYSAFMVASKVTIDTLSWQPGSSAVHWESEEGTTFAMDEGDYATRGTKITLYLSEDSYEFSNEYRAKEVLEKYCSFMPVPIFFTNADAEKQEEDGKADTAKAANEESSEEKAPEAEKPINDPVPLWLRHPNDCSADDYKEFYRKVFRDYKEPLFQIHLNMDYPFKLKGILYFPKVNFNYDNLEGTIKLYSNQVFIADNIKEVIPEFLLLLKGVIDCPDLPLNVSRSALQNDGFVKKISDYITKKVADKLTGMFNVERESYEKYWDDISPFIKYGCLNDAKFRDKVKDVVLFKDLDKKFRTLPEYLEEVLPKENEEAQPEVVDENGDTITGDESEKDTRKTIYYVTDETQQGQYIRLFREQKLNALLLTHNIDQPFISRLEQDYPDYRFCRIDSEIDAAAKDEANDLTDEQLSALTQSFQKALGDDKKEIKVEKLKNAEIASMIILSEESRRMNDMMKMYGMDMTAFPTTETLVLNSGNALVKYVLEHPNGEHTEMVCKQLYDLAALSHRPLDPESMAAFIARSNKIMTLLLS